LTAEASSAAEVNFAASGKTSRKHQFWQKRQSAVQLA
jgi:hypothetical protein